MNCRNSDLPDTAMAPSCGCGRKMCIRDRFISEAVDQTRGWFYSLLAESTLLFNEPPYQNVIVLGHVQDENGQKMSKSKGNAVDPFDALKTVSYTHLDVYKRQILCKRKSCGVLQSLFFMSGQD